MDKPIKDWGNGIPEYQEEDILAGLELHEFCTNAVAKSMQEDGYNIEGIIVDNTPTQVIANKNGKRFFVIVAGDVYPYQGRISYRIKKKFSDFCKQQGVTPLFASVGLMSSDPERAEAGLALKYDGYYIKYQGNEDISNVTIPKKKSPDYKAYCVEKIINAYQTGNFDELYKDFTRKIEFHSQWVLEPLIGKRNVIKYFKGKGETLRKSNTSIAGEVVKITDAIKRTGNIMLFSENGSLCALLSQQIDGKTNWIFITPEFNKKNKLVKISLNDPSLFSFRPYYKFE